MSEPVLLAWIGVIGTLLAGLVGKVSWDSHRTRRDTAAVHESINNRPTSLSDRIDEVLTEVQHVKRSVRGLRSDVLDHDARLTALEGD